jgi:hypothetical protein
MDGRKYVTTPPRPIEAILGETASHRQPVIYEAYMRGRLDCFSLDDLREAVPEFIEKHWPKNNTAAGGGEPTPGRGEAMVTMGMFLAELPELTRERR